MAVKHDIQNNFIKLNIDKIIILYKNVNDSPAKKPPRPRYARTAAMGNRGLPRRRCLYVSSNIFFCKKNWTYCRIWFKVSVTRLLFRGVTFGYFNMLIDQVLQGTDGVLTGGAQRGGAKSGSRPVVVYCVLPRLFAGTRVSVAAAVRTNRQRFFKGCVPSR